MPLDLFSKTPMPSKLPNEMEKIINEIKKSLNKEECLKKIYQILILKHRGYRIKTYLKLFDVFMYNITKLWNKNGFLHCTNINYVMRILLF
jgi:lysyl-tRNA synthetase class I